MKRSNRRVAALAVGALLAAQGASAVAASQLFKCVDGGRTVYQQQACAPSAQPEPAASAPHAAAKAGATGSMAKTPVADATSVGTRKLKASSSPASAAPAAPR